MDSSDVSNPKSSPRHRLGDVVELYMKNRIPRDLHPSYQAIDDKIDLELRPAPPPYAQPEPIFQSSQQHSEIILGESEDEEEFSL